MIKIIIFFLTIMCGDYFIFLFINYIYNSKLTINNIKDLCKVWHGNIINYILFQYFSFKLNWFSYIKPYDLFLGFLYFIMVDFIFYNIHYLVHTKCIYNKIHKFHHKCKPLIVICTRNSHWIDATLENISFFLPFFIFNYHGFIFLFCLLTNAFWIAYLHSGEIKQIKQNSLFITPTHHTIHHKYEGCVSYNYALYFTFWDYIFNTLKTDI